MRTLRDLREKAIFQTNRLETKSLVPTRSFFSFHFSLSIPTEKLRPRLTTVKIVQNFQNTILRYKLFVFFQYLRFSRSPTLWSPSPPRGTVVSRLYTPSKFDTKLNSYTRTLHIHIYILYAQQSQKKKKKQPRTLYRNT